MLDFKVMVGEKPLKFPTLHSDLFLILVFENRKCIYIIIFRNSFCKLEITRGLTLKCKSM